MVRLCVLAEVRFWKSLSYLNAIESAIVQENIRVMVLAIEALLHALHGQQHAGEV